MSARRRPESPVAAACRSPSIRRSSAYVMRVGAARRRPGWRTVMLVRDVMTKEVVTATIDTTVSQIAALLASKRISAVPIVDSAGHVLGMVSEGDLLRRVEIGTEKRHSWWLDLFADATTRAREFTKQEGVKAEYVMSRPVISIGEDAPLARAADVMQRRNIKRLPVVRDGKLVGIVGRADIVRALATAAAAQPAIKDDRAIDEALHARLRALSWLDTTFVNFTVEKGVVSAFGFVDDAEQKRALRAAVESVPGVKRLDDHL